MMNNKYSIGIDIGGTNTVLGFVNDQGCIVDSSSLKTASFVSIDAYVDAISTVLKKMIDKLGGTDYVEGIGIGASDGNYFKGAIESSTNLPWKGEIPLVRMLQNRLQIPCVLTNDANAAAIGEMMYGVARGMNNFIMITLGTGLGSGIVVNGQLVYGHDGMAGELGHVIVRRNGRQCSCGRKGCLETYCSATGVVRTAHEFLQNRADESSLRAIPTDELTSKDVYEAALKGDVLAKEIFEYTGTILGEALADFIAFFSPEAIILFGGLAKAGDWIAKPLQEALDSNVLKIYKGKTKILFSELNDADIAILGASALVHLSYNND